MTERLYHWRKWERRAETMLRNAEELFSQTYDILGEEDPFVVRTDDTMGNLENLVANIKQTIAHIKKQKAKQVAFPAIPKRIAARSQPPRWHQSR